MSYVKDSRCGYAHLRQNEKAAIVIKISTCICTCTVKIYTFIGNHQREASDGLVLVLVDGALLPPAVGVVDEHLPKRRRHSKGVVLYAVRYAHAGV